MGPVILVEHVGKRFRRYHKERPATIQELVAKGIRRSTHVEYFWGVRDVSFQVTAGKTVGIVGSNGSGKSTLLRLIGGVGRPDTGRIDVRGRVGALLDLGAGFHPDLTGRENALLAGILNGLTRRELLAQFDSIVSFAEIEKAIDSPVRTYSSGMQMRLAFSVAVHTRPDVLLIDEVLAVGDAKFQRKCLERILHFKETGCSILLVSHVARVVDELCDEAVWLNRGDLMVHGPTADVMAQYTAHLTEDRGDTPPTPSNDAPPEEPADAPAQPPIIVQSPGGTRVRVDAERFGSMELAITSARVLDVHGQAITEVHPGQPVTIALEYVANTPLVAPIFGVTILRADGTVMCAFGSQSVTAVREISGAGRIAVHIDRLDLNSGPYMVGTVCYAQDWAYVLDLQPSLCSFVVPAGGPKYALLDVPHHWEIADAPAPTTQDVDR